MAAALEERCSRGVICRDEAIDALKKKNETLEAKKVRLSKEIRGLSSARQELEALRKEKRELKTVSEVLKKEKEEAEASVAVLRESASQLERAKDLAMQRAEKAEDVADRLRKELDAERTLLLRCNPVCRRRRWRLRLLLGSTPTHWHSSEVAPLLLRPAATLGLASRG